MCFEGMAGAVADTVFQRGGRLLSIINEEAQDFTAGVLSALSVVTTGEMFDCALLASAVGCVTICQGVSIALQRQPQLLVVIVTNGVPVVGVSVSLSLVVVCCGVLMVMPMYCELADGWQPRARVEEPQSEAEDPPALPLTPRARGLAEPPPPAAGRDEPSPPADRTANSPLAAAGPARAVVGPATMLGSQGTSRRPMERLRKPNGVAPPPAPRPGPLPPGPVCR
mmetsp:Transcript_103098/g.287700  ORF Transcript_103098/g.287700 Transcript_103098/m.287700 type:complete len:225 (+) Transcript_103098:107-781(+)